MDVRCGGMSTPAGCRSGLRLLFLLLSFHLGASGDVEVQVPSGLGATEHIHRKLVQDFFNLPSTKALYPAANFTVVVGQGAPTGVALLQEKDFHSVQTLLGSTGGFHDLYQVLGRSWFVDTKNNTKFINSTLRRFTSSNGELRALPNDLQTGVLFYRKDLMFKYGKCTCNTPLCQAAAATNNATQRDDCDPPETWDELQEVAKVIQDQERLKNEQFWGLIFEAGRTSDNFADRAIELFASHADPAEPDLVGLSEEPIIKNGTVVVNRNHTKLALERLVNWFGYISPFPMKTWNPTTLADNFKNANAAFMINKLSSLSWINTAKDVQGKVGVSRSPGDKKGLGRGVSDGSVYVISKSLGGSDLSAAGDLLKYLSTEAAHMEKSSDADLGHNPAVLEWRGARVPLNLPPPAPTLRICTVPAQAPGCPLCGWPCDIDFTGSYVIHRPSDQQSFANIRAEIRDVVWKVINNEKKPDKAAREMECKIAEFIGQTRPVHCTWKNDCGLGNTKSGDTCTRCAPGKYADLHLDNCKECDPGKFAAKAGSSACGPCSAGNFTNQIGATACMKCERGRFQRQDAQSVCTLCEKGFIQTSPGQTECTSCPLKFYSDVAGNPSSCIPCPLGRTTNGQGTDNFHQCHCPKDTYRTPFPFSLGDPNLPFPLECRQCPMGMVCAGKNESIRVAKGYSAGNRSMLPPQAFEGVSEEFSVFKCEHNERSCPGGPVGQSCAPGRIGIACWECEPGKAAVAEGGCNECTTWSKAVLWIAIVFSGVAAFCAYWFTDAEETISPKHSGLLIGLVGSLLITSIQQFGVIQTMSVDFVEPVSTLLRLLSNVMSFDMYNSECIAALRPQTQYLWKVTSVFFLMIMVIGIHVGFVIVKHRLNFRKRMPRLIFVMGTLLMVFLISTVNTAISPLQCNGQPNNLKTVQKYPTVICFKTSEHTFMTIIGVTSLLVPLGFLASVCFAVYHFPARMQRGDLAFLQAFSFLFVRFRPEYYWYILVFMARNFVIAMAPILQEPASQVMVISGVLLASLVPTALFLPWRARVANGVDILITTCTVQFAYLVAFFVNADLTSLASMCSVFVVVILCTPWIFMSYAALAYITLMRRKPYKFFLCHHKGGAGALARYLKLLLLELMGQVSMTLTVRKFDSQAHRRWVARKSTGAGDAFWRALCAKQSVFIDCDDLENLDTLFDVVASSVETVVAIQSKSLLMRPWCMGELVTAFKKHVKVERITFPDFVEPSDDFARHYDTFVDIACLGPHGISKAMIHDTLVWLRELPFMELPDTVAPVQMRAVASALIRKKKLLSVTDPKMGPQKTADSDARSIAITPSSNFKSTSTAKSVDQTGVFVVVDHSSIEAAASAEVLCSMAMPHMVARPGMMPMVLPKGFSLPQTATVVAFAFSNGCFMQPCFVKALINAAMFQVRCLPLVVEDGFRFPVTPDAEDEIRNMVKNTPWLDIMMQSSDVLISVIRDVFKEVAISFAPQYSGTDTELMVKAEEIARRLLRPDLSKLQQPGEGAVRFPRQNI